MNSHRFGGGMIEYEFQFDLLEVVCMPSSLLSWLCPISTFHMKQNISHMMTFLFTKQHAGSLKQFSSVMSQINLMKVTKLSN